MTIAKIGLQVTAFVSHTLQVKLLHDFRSWFFMHARDIQWLSKTGFIYILSSLVHDEALVLFLLLCKIIFRSSQPEVFLGKGVLKICSKFTGEHPCRSAISIKLLSNFIEITLRHGRSPVILLHIFRTLFLWTPLAGCFYILLK